MLGGWSRPADPSARAPRWPTCAGRSPPGRGRSGPASPSSPSSPRPSGWGARRSVRPSAPSPASACWRRCPAAAPSCGPARPRAACSTSSSPPTRWRSCSATAGRWRWRPRSRPPCTARPRTSRRWRRRSPSRSRSPTAPCTALRRTIARLSRASLAFSSTTPRTGCWPRGTRASPRSSPRPGTPSAWSTPVTRTPCRWSTSASSTPYAAATSSTPSTPWPTTWTTTSSSSRPTTRSSPRCAARRTRRTGSRRPAASRGSGPPAEGPSGAGVEEDGVAAPAGAQRPQALGAGGHAEAHVALRAAALVELVDVHEVVGDDAAPVAVGASVVAHELDREVDPGQAGLAADVGDGQGDDPVLHPVLGRVVELVLGLHLRPRLARLAQHDLPLAVGDDDVQRVGVVAGALVGGGSGDLLVVLRLRVVLRRCRVILRLGVLAASVVAHGRGRRRVRRGGGVLPRVADRDADDEPEHPGAGREEGGLPAPDAPLGRARLSGARLSGAGRGGGVEAVRGAAGRRRGRERCRGPRRRRVGTGRGLRWVGRTGAFRRVGHLVLLRRWYDSLLPPPPPGAGAVPRGCAPAGNAGPPGRAAGATRPGGPGQVSDLPAASPPLAARTSASRRRSARRPARWRPAPAR